MKEGTIFEYKGRSEKKEKGKSQVYNYNIQYTPENVIS